VFTVSIRNATAFLFGLAIIGLIAVCVGGEPKPQTYIGIVVAYQDGKVITSQSIGYAASQEDCMKGVESVMVELVPKPGVTLAALCTPAPPPPPVSTLPPQSKQPLLGKNGEDRI
jgi:hypothetical protein